MDELPEIDMDGVFDEEYMEDMMRSLSQERKAPSQGSGVSPKKRASIEQPHEMPQQAPWALPTMPPGLPVPMVTPEHVIQCLQVWSTAVVTDLSRIRQDLVNLHQMILVNNQFQNETKLRETIREEIREAVEAARKGMKQEIAAERLEMEAAMKEEVNKIRRETESSFKRQQADLETLGSNIAELYSK